MSKLNDFRVSKDDFFAGPLGVVGEDGDFGALAPRVDGAHDDAPQAGVFFVRLFLIAEAIGQQIPAMVAGTLVDEGSGGGAVLLPAVAAVVLFPGDEVQMGMGGELGEDLGPEDAAVDDYGEGLVFLEA